jgi:hypothetical protein
MVYKLEFDRTFEGLLRVCVSAGSHSDHAIAIYEDDRAFLSLVRIAFLDPCIVMTLQRAVIIAFSPAKSHTTCEGLTLTDEQLIFLRLGMARRLSA